MNGRRARGGPFSSWAHTPKAALAYPACPYLMLLYFLQHGLAAPADASATSSEQKPEQPGEAEAPTVAASSPPSRPLEKDAVDSAVPDATSASPIATDADTTVAAAAAVVPLKVPPVLPYDLLVIQSDYYATQQPRYVPMTDDSAACLMAYESLVLHWSAPELYSDDAANAMVEHESCSASRGGREAVKKVTLQDCLELYTTREQVGCASAMHCRVRILGAMHSRSPLLENPRGELRYRQLLVSWHCGPQLHDAQSTHPRVHLQADSF